MAGRRLLLILTTGLFGSGFLACSAFAAPPQPTPVGKMLAVNDAVSGANDTAAKPSSAPAPTPKEWSRAPMPNPTVDSPELDMMRRTIDSLTPEQRQRFKENLIRWTNLSPGERKTLREREEFRRNKMTEETDRAFRETGLTLTPEQREQFARRYGEERRLVEEKLRKDIEEMRRPMVRDLISRLRTEFSPGGTVAPPPPSPAESPLARP